MRRRKEEGPEALAPNPLLVQRSDHLRDPRPRLRRLERRRHRRLQRPRRASSTICRISASPRSGCCRSIPRRCATTATTSPTTRASTRPTARSRTSRGFLKEAHARGIRVITELVLNHTSTEHAWFQRARRAAPGHAVARLLRVERHAEPLRRRAHHLQGLRDLELDVGSGGQGLLLASLLLAPARSELRQPRGAQGALQGHRLLARARRRRRAPRRRALPLRARRHQLREPARDARVPASKLRTHVDARYPRSHAAGRGQPVARRRRRLLRRRRRVPHELPLPADAAHVHGGRSSRIAFPIVDILRQTPTIPAELPVGDVPAQPRRADARDGHRRRSRLHVSRLRRGSATRASTSASAAGWRRWSKSGARSS